MSSMKSVPRKSAINSSMPEKHITCRFNLFELANTQGLPLTYSSLSPVAARLDIAEKERVERRKEYAKILQTKENNAKRRKDETKLRLIERLGKHHVHVEQILLRTRKDKEKEDLCFRNVVENDLPETSMYARNCLITSQTRDKIIRAAAQRGVLAIQKRIFNLENIEKNNRAVKNRVSQLESRQKKCRFQVSTAQSIGRRVRATRVIQHVVKKHILKHLVPVKSSPCVTSKNGAMIASKSALKVQTWIGWRIAVAVRKFQNIDIITGISPRDAISRIISEFVNLHPDGQYSFVSLETCQDALQDDDVLKNASHFLRSLDPLMAKSDTKQSSTRVRTFLSSFLIASHPNEVLRGGDVEVRVAYTKMVHNRSIQVLESIMKLCVEDALSINKRLLTIASSIQAFAVTFEAWRELDLDLMVNELLNSAKSTFVFHLCEFEVLKLIDKLSSEVFSMSQQEDPLASLRIEHEAGFEGSQRHLSRLNKSLSKLVGPHQSQKLMNHAESDAKQIADQTFSSQADSIKDEVMRIYGSKYGKPSVGTTTSMEKVVLDFDRAEKNDILSETSNVCEMLLSNEKLVHEILLCEPEEYHLLTIDGNLRLPNISFQNFFNEWKDSKLIPGIASNTDEEITMSSLHSTFYRAFFDTTFDELNHDPPVKESFNSIVIELNKIIRSMISNRNNHHLHEMNEDDFNFKALIQPLIGAAKVLREIESQDRRLSTSEWLDQALSKNMMLDKANLYFIVSSSAFLLIKARTCYTDVSNSSLHLAAPYICSMGVEYERDYFREKFGLNIPVTRAWLKTAFDESNLVSNDVSLGAASVEHRKNMMSTAFVDYLLFTRKRLVLPEVFRFDQERIQIIRDTSRVSVIGCALSLHACNIAKVGVSILSSKHSRAISDNEKNHLILTLTQKYHNTTEFNAKVGDSTVQLCKALFPSSSVNDKFSEKSLRNHVAAVIRGDDPVLKLLDQRIRLFYRTMCKWQPTRKRTADAPRSMATGRLLSNNSSHASRLAKTELETKASQKRDFLQIAEREATRQGFSFFANDLALSSRSAWKILHTMHKVHDSTLIDQILL